MGLGKLIKQEREVPVYLVSFLPHPNVYLLIFNTLFAFWCLAVAVLRS